MSLEEAVRTVVSADKALNAADPKPFPVPSTGLESVIAGAVKALRAGDWWVPGLRERVGAVLRDTPLERLTDGFAGARPYKVVPPTPSPANRALYAVGLALSDRDRAVLVHLGIGSASDGTLFEALNAAALHRANVVFLVAVHPLGEGAPLGRQVAAAPAAVAAALGLQTATVSGASAQAVHDAVASALAAGGPHLITANL
ncbi:MAG: thiamine pyrophosphate-dependent enzyme [Myxococcota bacterium]